MTLIQHFFGSIANRVFLLLALGITVAIFVTFSLSQREDRYALQTLRDDHEAERVVQFVRLMESVPGTVRQQIIQSETQIGLHATLSPSQPVTQTDDLLVTLLRKRLPNGVVLRQAGSNAGCMRRSSNISSNLFLNRPLPPQQQDCRVIDLTLSDGTPLHLTLGWSFGRLPDDTPLRFNFPWHLVVFFGLIAMLAYVGARMIVKPLRRMTYLTDELGRNIDRPALPEEGPTEIRHAIAAVNGMQAQIRRHIEQRMFMLSAIAHDLQTPLTRLRLRLEKVSDETLRAQLLKDLAATQQMVREGLEFARSMNSVETFQNIDIDSLLETLCADAADAGQPVSFTGQTGATVQASLGSLRRCIANLLDNAMKYGLYANVEVAWVQNKKQVEIRVADGGPGVPADQLETVFDPFYRVENSRSRETGGVGLGLAIARNIAQKHGGQLRLENGHIGAVAILTLPITPHA